MNATPNKKHKKDSFSPPVPIAQRIVDADNLLKISEMRYRRLFETAQDGIIIMDAETELIIDANPFIAKMINVSALDIIGKRLPEAGVFKNKEKAEQLIYDLNINNYSRLEDHLAGPKNKKITDVEIIGNAYLVSNHRFFQLNIRDITERRQSLRELQESELKFKTMMMVSPVGIFCLNNDGRYSYVNERWSEITGLPFEEAKKLLWVEIIHPDDYRTVWEQWQKSVDIETQFFQEFRIQLPNGEVNWVICHCLIERDFHNCKIGSLGSITNITGLKNTELALKDSIAQINTINVDLHLAKEKAEESDRLKSAFLANMSHEIRTPMNAIMGFSDFLIQPGITHDKIIKYASIINSSGQQLLTIINDIIDISTIEAGQVSIFMEPIELNSLIKDVHFVYKNQILEKKINFTFSMLNNQLNSYMMGDENRIKQILYNLLNNALKFTKEGEITFGYSIKNDWVEFHVKDTGIGISQENLILIFERFRQVEDISRRYGGTGLGLSISKALVEKMGGSITVSSILGKGSLFTFTIPYKPVLELAGNEYEVKHKHK